jgi:hypothetical protein
MPLSHATTKREGNVLATPRPLGRSIVSCMTDLRQLEIIRRGAKAWNQWRTENPPELTPDFREANLRWADLRGANLSEVHLREANLSEADLTASAEEITKSEIKTVLSSSTGVFKSIDVAGASFTNATGINNAGKIVGFYGDSAGVAARNKVHGMNVRSEICVNGRVARFLRVPECRKIPPLVNKVDSQPVNNDIDQITKSARQIACRMLFINRLVLGIG